VLLSLLHLVAVGLPVPSPVPGLPQLEPAVLGPLIKPCHQLNWLTGRQQPTRPTANEA